MALEDSSGFPAMEGLMHNKSKEVGLTYRLPHLDWVKSTFIAPK